MIRTKQSVRKKSGLRSLATAVAGMTCGLTLVASVKPAQAVGKIVAMSAGSPSPDIARMNSDGSGWVNLNNNDGSLQKYPSISGSGNKIAYLQNDGFLWVMNSDGSGKTQIASLIMPANTSMNWDGTKIAFATVLSLTSDDGRKICLINSNGTGFTSFGGIPGVCEMPAFSPDGTKIVFVRGQKGGAEIYVMNVDGSGLTRLTNNAKADLNPSFSPDGTKIVFDSAATDYYGNLTDPYVYMMSATGGAATQITSTPGYDPCFSPDGTQIAFGATSYINSSPRGDLWILAAVPESSTNVRVKITGNHPAPSSWPCWGW